MISYSGFIKVYSIGIIIYTFSTLSVIFLAWLVETVECNRK